MKTVWFFPALNRWLYRPSIFLFFLGFFFFSSGAYAQVITVSNETFPQSFNTGFTAPAQNVNSGNFSGSTGTWAASSNANATTVVLPAYYSPVTNAIKIVNWNTAGKTFGECIAASPTVNLSGYLCSPAMQLQFALYTYTCNPADANTQLHLEFSTNNGSSWTSVYSRSSAQIFNTWGANAITTINVPIDPSYRVAGFRYRFRGNKPGNQSNDFYVFIDDIKITATACPAPCTGRVTNLYFNELNGGPDLPITNGSTFTLSQLGSLYNMEAGTSGTIGSVLYTITGPSPSSNTENVAPYNSPGTGSGAWSGAPGVYQVNMKTYSSANATGTLCHDTTISFTLVDNNCTCPGNLVQNPSYENGTTGWHSSGGTFTAGTGAVRCGVKSGDFQITNTTSNWVSQTIATDLPAGTTLDASVFAGTHDNTFYHQVSVDFFDAGWNWISNAAVEVNKVLAAGPAGPQFYSWTAVVPPGTKYTNVSFSGNGSWIKVDQWCVTTRPPGSIGNRVWHDVNRNGIQDAGEVGLSGVPVTLLNASGVPVASTLTDALGTYQFSNLPVGSSGTTYEVRFGTAAGYVFAPRQADGAGLTGPDNSDAVTGTGRTGPVVLTPASPNVSYVDAGLFATQPSRIGDFIWNDLDKDGVQDAGEPGISGVVITLFDNAGNPVQTTFTDNNGYYDFNDVPNGTYTIGLTPPPGYQVSPADAGGDDARDNDFSPTSFRTAPFNYTGGVNLTFDGGLNVTPATKASVGDFVWADLDNDQVQDAFEPGIAGVTVQLFTAANVLVGTTATNALGYYVFNNVDPGSYYVRFSTTPAGYVFVTADTGTDDTKDSDVTGTNGAGTTATFTLTADQNNMTLDAGLRRSSPLNSLGDYVWYDLNKNGSQDPGEAGVPGVTVSLFDAAAGALLQSTVTNGLGQYMFTDLAAGSYIVGFGNLPTGHTFTTADAVADAADSDPNPNTGRTAVVTIAGTGNIITTVDAGLISSPGGFDARGAIGDLVWNDINNNGIQDAGEPGVPGVTVTLFAADGTTVIATTTTDALGNYQFTNLPAATYIVGFTNLPAGYVFGNRDAGTDDTRDSDPDPATGRTSPFSLLPGQINMTLDAAVRNPTPLARIGNFVWNDLNGNGFQDAGEPGIPGVSVFLLDNAGMVLRNTVTDPSGSYLFTDLAAGTYRVRIGNLPAGMVATTKDALPVNDATDSDADPSTLTTDNFSLAAGAADLSRDFGLRSTTTASLGDFVWDDTDGDGIQDAGEKGVAGVLVTLYNNSGVAVASAVTDAAGRYLFVNVAPGTYSLEFSNLPAGSVFSPKDATGDAADSDVNTGTGRTDPFVVTAGQADLSRDAGLVTRYAAVGNYVWLDQNGNGIQDAGELPVAGVTVTLRDAANNPVAAAVSDGNGLYLINNIPVPAGGASYTLQFSDIPDGSVFTASNAAGSTPENNSDAVPATGITPSFTLLPGQIRLDQDAGLVTNVTLSGNVWHDVNGMSDGFVNNSGGALLPPAAPIPPVLRAYLVNFSTGLVERVVFVNPANGTFTFGQVKPNTNYFVVISSSLGIAGNLPPASVLPSGWQHTGQKLGVTSGSDGLNDGRLIVPVNTTPVINANFGIRVSGGDVVIG